MDANFLIAPISYDWAALLVRFAIGIALLPFAIKKFLTRETAAKEFYSVMFFTQEMSFYMAMFMEFSTSILVILGLFTRIAAIGGIATMAIATKYSKGKYFTSPAQAYLLGFIAILFIGPGKFSLDWLFF